VNHLAAKARAPGKCPWQRTQPLAPDLQAGPLKQPKAATPSFEQTRINVTGTRLRDGGGEMRALASLDHQRVGEGTCARLLVRGGACIARVAPELGGADLRVPPGFRPLGEIG